jgi:hypothetical protein
MSMPASVMIFAMTCPAADGSAAGGEGLSVAGEINSSIPGSYQQ